LDFNRKNPAGQSVLRDFIPRDLMEMSLFLKIQRYDGMVTGYTSPLLRSNSLASTSSVDSSYGLASPMRRHKDQQANSPRGLVCSSCQAQVHLPKSNLATILNPERWKTAVAILYALSVSWLTALTMTVVHDRVPDMNKYPPLPDIILDNVPHIPWAFEMT
jgi:hypothetical protein